jgi:predicted ATP-grasp superfamily ATP-dependent carboligase
LERKECPFVIQSFIPGGDDQLYTAGVFSYKGEVISSFSGRKLRQFPPTIGEASYAELVDVKPIIEYAERYIKKTGFTGMAQIEFKKYEDDYYLMEINPRSWSWHSIGLAAGVNLPWSAVNMAHTGKKIQYKQTVFKGTWIYTLEDFISHVLHNRNITIFKHLKDSLTADAHAIFHPRDILPAIVFIKQRLGIVLKKLVRKMNIR